MIGAELLMLLVPAVGALLVLAGLWAGNEVRRVRLLQRMEEAAADARRKARKYPHTERATGEYSAQAEHLERHIRTVRGLDVDAGSGRVAHGVDPDRGAVGGRGARADRP